MLSIIRWIGPLLAPGFQESAASCAASTVRDNASSSPGSRYRPRSHRHRVQEDSVHSRVARACTGHPDNQARFNGPCRDPSPLPILSAKKFADCVLVIPDRQIASAAQPCRSYSVQLPWYFFCFDVLVRAAHRGYFMVEHSGHYKRRLSLSARAVLRWTILRTRTRRRCCRRSRLLRKKLRIPKAASTQPIHLMIDSTRLRIHVGNARKPPKQRAWRKLHIAVDRETGNIVASELTASRARDATRVPALLTQIQAPLVSVAADSAYDKEAVYEAIEAHSPGRRTRVVIPPQRNATLSQNSNTAMQERDRHIRAIERHGRREWYKLSGYTKRSMVENAVYRYKAIIGPEMRARTLARQRVEHRIGCEILNKMAALGMPDTYCAG